MQLVPFDPCDSLRISADVRRSPGGFDFTYRLEGDTSDVVIPPRALAQRTDGLWQATCFEVFLSVGKTSYLELNFAPSGEWAAYRFTDYRQGMRELEVGAPEIRLADDCLVASIDLEVDPGTALNLTAVIEHKDGARSYWALAHPKSNRPDFHARDCFIAKLP
jgi:hypothetical protein